MSVWPGARLVRALAAGVLVALAASALPALLVPLAGAALVLLALVALDARLLARLAPVSARRELPERAFVGRGDHAAIALSNPGPGTRHVDVFEELPRDVSAHDPESHGLAIPPGETRRFVYDVAPTRRGDRALGRAVVLERSPLGFLRRRSEAPGGAALRVFPDAARLWRREALDPRLAFAALGARPARRRGEGSEFESLREWGPGDDPRHLDWAASARRGRPIVRLFEQERSQTVVLALDASRLMAARAGDRSKLDHAVDAALALAYASLATGDTVGLVAYDREVRAQLRPRRHRHDLADLIESLRTLEPRPVEADHRVLARHLGVHHPKRALVVVLTDFVEAPSPELTAPLALLARRHQVLLVALRDPLFDELDAGGSGAFSLERRLVLDDLLRERDVALASLRRRGVDVLDLPPGEITGAVLNRYLALRER